jgi:hypothetical protein
MCPVHEPLALEAAEGGLDRLSICGLADQTSQRPPAAAQRTQQRIAGRRPIEQASPIVGQLVVRLALDPRERRGCRGQRVARRREVVVGHPQGEVHDLVGQKRRGVENLRDVTNAIGLRAFSRPDDDARDRAVAERHQHAGAAHGCRRFRREAIREERKCRDRNCDRNQHATPSLRPSSLVPRP